jgi:hypothetical protein
MDNNLVYEIEAFYMSYWVHNVYYKILSFLKDQFTYTAKEWARYIGIIIASLLWYFLLRLYDKFPHIHRYIPL